MALRNIKVIILDLFIEPQMSVNILIIGEEGLDRGSIRDSMFIA